MNRWKCPDCKGWVAPEVTVHFCEKQGQVTPWPQNPDYRYYRPPSFPYVPVTPNHVRTRMAVLG